MNAFSKAISVKARIISALFVHSILTDHGKTKIGYLTAVIKPLFQIVMLTAMLTLLGGMATLGDSFLLFLSTGLIPYNLCIGLANKIMQLNKTHRVILTSTPVTPFDISIALLLSETLIMLIVTSIVLFGLAHFDHWDYKVDSLIGLLLITIASVTLGYAIGVINTAISAITPSYEKIWRILSMPIFLMSGIFFVVDSKFPQALIDILKWNPLLHIIEYTRDSIYRSWQSVLFDLNYLLWFIIGSLFVALLMQKITQTKALT